MTIQEAIETTKPFRLPKWSNNWITVDLNANLFKLSGPDSPDLWKLFPNDFLSLDWEVKLCNTHNTIAINQLHLLCATCLGEAVTNIVPPEIKLVPKCSCDLRLILSKGCQCGGI